MEISWNCVFEFLWEPWLCNLENLALKSKVFVQTFFLFLLLQDQQLILKNI